MTDTRSPLDGFEERLLTELRAEVRNRPAPEVRPSTHRRRRYAVAGAAALMVGGAAAVAGPMLLDSSSTPSAAAYALHVEPDGSIFVTIRRLENAKGLEHAFAKQGVRAQVDFVPKGKACAPRHYRHVHVATRMMVSARIRPTGKIERVTFQVHPDQLAGHTLVIVASPHIKVSPHEVDLGGGPLVTVDTADGPVPPCTLVDAPGH